MTATIEVRFDTYRLAFDRYGNNDRLAIDFEDADGFYYSDLTVNLPGVELDEREVVINANSADHDLIDAAEQAGFFAYTDRSYRSGFVVYRVAELSEDFYNLACQEADK